MLKICLIRRMGAAISVPPRRAIGRLGALR